MPSPTPSTSATPATSRRSWWHGTGSSPTPTATVEERARPGRGGPPAAAQAGRAVRVHELDAHGHAARRDARHLLLHDRRRPPLRRQRCPSSRWSSPAPCTECAAQTMAKAAQWDLTALVNAADPKAGAGRTPPVAGAPDGMAAPCAPACHVCGPPPSAAEEAAHAAAGAAPAPPAEPDSKNTRTLRETGALALVQAFWRDIDAASLYADFGFGARVSLASELACAACMNACCRARPKPATWPACSGCLFEPATPTGWRSDRHAHARRAWRCAAASADEALPRARRCWMPSPSSSVPCMLRATRPALRQRMDAAVALGRTLPPAHARRHHHAARGGARTSAPADALRESRRLPARPARRLPACAAASVMPHLEQYGVSVNIVFDLDQLQAAARSASSSW